MCRLAFIPAKAPISRKNLESFLKQLEKSFGGDGNGYAAISPDGTVLIKKSLKLSCEIMAKEIHALKNQGWSIYFHTRKVSVGWHSDAQCHPFKIEGQEWHGTLCHNGTWMDGSVLAKYLNTGSDTATMAYLIGELGLETMDQRKLMPKSGVFLLYGGKPGETPTHNVLHLGGSLEYCPKTGVWASEFFKDWPHYHETIYVEEGSHSLEKPAPQRTFTKSYTSAGYGGYYQNAGAYRYAKTATGDDSKALSQYWDSKEDEDDSDIVSLHVDKDHWQDRHFYHN